MTTRARPGDIFERRFGFRRQDHAGTARKTGKQRGGLAEHVLEIAPGAVALTVDGRAFLGRNIADLEQAVDEQTQARFRGQAAG
jgi:hypothetical protein